ncbi:HGGxSTG domain-containing protein [Magnetospirillum molischianum]|nr:HGGxSTG domain-containing protein [Magnetospirillum molischianum]
MHLSPRCGAKTRAGTPCQSPAMANGRCRMHGGTSPGAPKGEANGNWRHGAYVAERFLRWAAQGMRGKGAAARAWEQEFLALPPDERAAVLEGVAMLRAFHAHRAASADLPAEGIDQLDTIFNRNARTVATIARARLVLALAAAQGVTMPSDQEPEADQSGDAVTEEERVERLIRVLEGAD